jgi:endonuclease-3
VDTHVRRLSQRLGLTRNEDPVKIERDLQRVVPRGDWGTVPAPPDLARAARPAMARRPACESCVLVDLCPAARIDVVVL